MSLFADLFSSILPIHASRKKEIVYLQGSGRFELEITGEVDYQDVLEELCGPRRLDGIRQFETARLILDERRAYHTNKNAVRVEIRGKLIGFLSLESTIVYRRYLSAQGAPKACGQCEAVIWGGWVTPDGSEGPYYVSLDMPDLHRAA